MPINLPTFSVFKIVEEPLSIAIEREVSQGTKGEDFWGNVLYPCTLLLIPFTIVADMIVGIARIVLSGVKGELDEDLFWKISEQHFFIYPFQQIVFLFSSIIGTVSHGNYVDGYIEGQRCVSNFSYEAYKGSPVIFNRDFCVHSQPFEPFPGHTLSEDERACLKGFKEEAAKLSVAMEKAEDLPECAGLKPILDRMRSAKVAYQMFIDQPPVHMRQVTPRFEEMKKEIKGCKGLTIDQKDQVLSYLHLAHDTLCAFFRISYSVRRRLLSNNPQLLSL